MTSVQSSANLESKRDPTLPPLPILAVNMISIDGLGHHKPKTMFCGDSLNDVFAPKLAPKCPQIEFFDKILNWKI